MFLWYVTACIKLPVYLNRSGLQPFIIWIAVLSHRAPGLEIGRLH